ncbi:MAG: exopolysaccharide biosynthesis protein [Deltaproteobacteria bacterium]|nr:exopolysaccharide biosynthesis protein [Deltaproteobacteria bacterium]MDQ3297413.1 exopolysaccharide biosynthesis protein [Myxococcota bacterium]
MAVRARDPATKRPRRLRMSELLLELGALDDEPPADEPPAADRDTTLSVGELVDKAAEGGFGFLIGILTLIAIPFFGLSTPFGLAIALIGAQMMVGRTQPWLPKRARQRELSMAMLDRVATMLARRTRWIVKVTRRRYEGLLQPRVIGFGIMLLALGLALPLPIPGSNLIFLVPIFIYALGMLERDGVWIAIGHACVLIDLALMVVFGATIVAVLSGIWDWIS